MDATQEKCDDQEKKLSAAQRARVERNRQRALLLRQTRLTKRPYEGDQQDSRQKISKVIDTKAGFFLEEEEEEERCAEVKVTHPLGPVLEVDNLICEDCGKEFMDSYFHTQFDANVCDNCRENQDKHPLITKTDAKNKYLLKDADFEKREPPLKFIIRKNPRNPRWGDMKLYYEPQVYERAMDIWESEDKIEEEREKRVESREKTKQKKFDKKIKELRLAVRSSLVKKDSGPHEHEYGEEEYDEDEDVYKRKCKTCSHMMSYEKM